jgi:hypothetical protein
MDHDAMKISKYIMMSMSDDGEARLRNGWIFSLLLGAPSVEGRIRHVPSVSVV